MEEIKEKLLEIDKMIDSEIAIESKRLDENEEIEWNNSKIDFYNYLKYSLRHSIGLFDIAG